MKINTVISNYDSADERENLKNEVKLLTEKTTKLEKI